MYKKEFDTKQTTMVDMPYNQTKPNYIEIINSKRSH